MRKLIRLPLGWVLILMMTLTLASCGADSKIEKKPASTPVAEQKLQQVHQFEQRMSGLLDQIAKQDKALSELRIQQDQTLGQAVEANKALMEEFVALRREMAQTLGYEAGAIPVLQSPTPPATVRLAPTDELTQAAKTPETQMASKTPKAENEKEGSRIGRAILRLILVIILLAAIWLIIQIFMGRWANDDEDEDEDEDDEDEDYILKADSDDLSSDESDEETPAPAEDENLNNAEDEDKKPS